MSGFTPGPWFIEEDMKVHCDDNGRPCGEEFINGINIIAGDDYIVTYQGLAGGNTDRANANLISAAPDLYHALEASIVSMKEDAVNIYFNDYHEIISYEELKERNMHPDIIDVAEAALAKARGES